MEKKLSERVFAWMGNSRCLSNDHGKTTSSAKAMITISHIHTLIKRYIFLADSPVAPLILQISLTTAPQLCTVS